MNDLPVVSGFHLARGVKLDSVLGESRIGCKAAQGDPLIHFEDGVEQDLGTLDVEGEDGRPGLVRDTEEVLRTRVSSCKR